MNQQYHPPSAHNLATELQSQRLLLLTLAANEVLHLMGLVLEH